MIIHLQYFDPLGFPGLAGTASPRPPEPPEATAMDPNQRKCMETVYEATADPAREVFWTSLICLKCLCGCASSHGDGASLLPAGPQFNRIQTCTRPYLPPEELLWIVNGTPSVARIYFSRPPD